MREFPVSNCERNFIQSGLLIERRIDGRTCEDFRKLKISIGVERGSCLVELGNTKVLAQVSCTLVTPKDGRPSEGSIYVSLDMSPMASPSYEAGRLGDSGVEMIRMIERCIKESRCIDCESLCLIAGKKVWQIRIDIHVLDNDGSLADCCSIAAITALLHFRRPDATVIGEEFVVHPVEEKNPVPLNVIHIPITVTFGVLERGTCLFVDPTELEEKTVEGRIIVGANAHREICAFHCSGNILIKKPQILRCSNIAVVRAIEVTNVIRAALANDAEARAKGERCGFAELIPTNTIKSHQVSEASVNVAGMPQQHIRWEEEPVSNVSQSLEAISLRGNVVQLGDGQSRLMSESEELMDVDQSSLKSQLLKDEDDVEIVKEIQRSTRKSPKVENEENVPLVQLSDDHSADEVVMVKEVKKPKKTKKTTPKAVDKEMDDLLSGLEQDAVTISGSDLGMSGQKMEAISGERETAEKKGKKKKSSKIS